ncbi:hypothetical protein FJT64_021005 [Amphibalanus amphitrite]|uniref:MBD domain-containing protein n=1 Tax=Amphibalanus amphitrite TaxID=1232801 RepID=A0A6A4WNR8_AMPAM|nr:hypothetical protein FJT64_021005 [Amphibalanus amphitrite]
MSSSEDEVKEITLKGPLAEPFKHGWRREVVRRSTFNSGKNRHRFDCYYYMPNGKKLRSKREVEDALEALDDEDMDISNFSFAHQLVGVGPPHESMREAGANTTPVRSAALRNKRLKIAINQWARSLGWLSVGLVDTRPWRLAVVAADGREAQTVDEPLRADPWRGVYVDQVRAQTPARLPPPYTLRIGRLRQYATCSLFCSRPGHPPPPVLPDLRCVGCFCLSHAACVGLPPPADPAHTDFLCMDCFDRLRRLSDEPASGRYDLLRRPVAPPTPMARPRPPVRFSVRPSRLPSAPVSDPDVEEIVVVASEEESDVLLAAAAAEEEVQEVSDDDVLSCSSDDSPELDPSSPMSWSDGQEEVLLGDSDDASVKSSSPSPVLQSSPPALTRGPPRLTARTARPPPLTGPPPPLQRAQAGTKDIQKVVVVNRAPQTTGGHAEAGRASPADTAVRCA